MSTHLSQNAEKLLKLVPRELLKKTTQTGTTTNLINYWWSGDINEGPDDPNLISLADHPYLPTSILQNRKEEPALLEAQQVQGPQLEAQPAI